MSEIRQQVIKLIAERAGRDESQITDDANFQNDLGYDSLETVELIMDFEKEFDIEIPDEDAESIQTVGDAVSYVEKQKA